MTDGSPQVIDSLGDLPSQDLHCSQSLTELVTCGEPAVCGESVTCELIDDRRKRACSNLFLNTCFFSLDSCFLRLVPCSILLQKQITDAPVLCIIINPVLYAFLFTTYHYIVRAVGWHPNAHLLPDHRLVAPTGCSISNH